MSLGDIPEYAKKDYVLRKIAEEARQTRRNWLADQVLPAGEPRNIPKKVPAWQEVFIKPFRPLDRKLNHGLTRAWRTGSKVFLFMILPVWVAHYMTKYHNNKPGNLVMSKPALYPGDSED
ncbi:NADH dehydrogenase [ubiquinone] 1 beta subcomplex subunit 6-like [Saccoglossus kowalevskii]|uniref:NADH dehydrogenase [ubiquinone] 1 beta subcomplex subunit 6 n=1 Tax=Saccoglossus kowalevskii TaxID=10224 RepID=A0ABM0GXE7_SACKO|nr:PREDICTED: NADH dehydrogenase [ubiquinone] 1 beta subcomplex subunit 6-like [Saccoglossus kowalevskii]